MSVRRWSRCRLPSRLSWVVAIWTREMSRNSSLSQFQLSILTSPRRNRCSQVREAVKNCWWTRRHVLKCWKRWLRSRESRHTVVGKISLSLLKGKGSKRRDRSHHQRRKCQLLLRMSKRMRQISLMANSTTQHLCWTQRRSLWWSTLTTLSSGTEYTRTSCYQNRLFSSQWKLMESNSSDLVDSHHLC